MRTPTRVRDNGFRLTATTASSADLVGTVALSLITPMTPPAIARPAGVAQPATR